MPANMKRTVSVGTTKTISFEKILFSIVILLGIVLALKSLKQFIYLSFTLLTLKFVWIIIIFLAFLTLIKKRTS
jgi:ABC-type siderophore export system fused ATPase/permease subunit